LKYFPANKQLLSVLLSSSSSSLCIQKATKAATISTTLGIDFEFEFEIGEKLLPLMIQIRRANLIATQEQLLRSSDSSGNSGSSGDSGNSGNSSKTLISGWGEDAVSVIRCTLEKLLDDPVLASLPTLWLFYLRLEVEHGDDNDASKIYYRALQSCPNDKRLWIFALGYLRIGIEEKGIRDIISVMEERGLFIRTQ
jgi:hypothetical protein